MGGIRGIENAFRAKEESIDNEYIRDVPKIIYHYTSVSGLIGLLSSKSIWASRASYLNDESEFAYGLDLCVMLIRELGKTQKYRRMAEIVIKELGPTSKAPFVACFCGNGDLLSQWRGYSQFGGGVSIAFYSNSIDSASENFELGNVIYEKDLQVEFLRRYISGIFDSFIEQKANLRERRILEDLQSYSGILEACCGLIKNPVFEEEGEIRLFAADHTVAAANVKFRQRGNFIVPYVRVGLVRSWKRAIASIIIGPGPDREARRKNVTEALELFQLPKVDIQLSTCQFRL